MEGSEVYVIQLLLVLPSAIILGSESRRTHDHILPYLNISDLSGLQPEGPGHRIYIPQEEGCPVILQALGLLTPPYLTSHLSRLQTETLEQQLALVI
jgi:hypothetical protein